MRRDDERLRDIVEAIERIQRHTEGGRTAFDEDELVQNWILHHLQIIGEAAARISEESRQRHPDIPWKGIVGMRNILVHGYFDIDRDAVWAAVEQELAPLKELRRDDIGRVAAAHGVVDVRVYGSVARGEARPDRDIDLLVEMAPHRLQRTSEQSETGLSALHSEQRVTWS